VYCRTQVAIKVTCDVTACGAVVLGQDHGQPSLVAKRDTYCEKCAGYIASVDREMDVEMTRRGFALVDELHKLREEKIAKVLPAQKGGTGIEGDWRIIPADEAPAQ